LFKVALKSDGQSADVVMAEGDLLPDPPVDVGLVVVDELVVGLVVVVVVDDDVLDLLPGLKMRSDSPTKISTAIPMVTNRRMLCLRFAAFCSDSRRACRPAF